MLPIQPHDFESLVDSLRPLIGSVTPQKDGSLAVTFTQEPSWDSGVVPYSPGVKAGVALVARSAAYMAAKLNLSGGELDIPTTIQMRELSVDATKFLTKHPWFNDAESQKGLCPISVVQALRVDPDFLKEKLKPVKPKFKLAMGLAALEATAVACALARPGPAPIVTEVVTPSASVVMPTVTETHVPKVDITPTPSGPEYKGVPLHTLDEAKQIILEQGNMDPEYRNLNLIPDDAYPLFSVIWKPNPNGADSQYVISYQGIVENANDFTPDWQSLSWYNNTILVNGNPTDCTLFAVIGSESGHSFIIFTDKSGNHQVLLVDQLFIFQQEYR